MYVKYRKDSYKFVVYTGIPACILTGILLYYAIRHNLPGVELGFLSFIFCVTYTLFYFIKYLNKNLNFLALRIDEDGMFVCEKKNEGIFIPWEKIKHVIFVIDAGNRGSIIIIRQHNKETHYFTLTYYFWSFRPKSAIEAAYRYADDKKKIREVKDYICLHYESIMWNISEREKNSNLKEKKINSNQRERKRTHVNRGDRVESL
jgi:hypothetical protein